MDKDYLYGIAMDRTKSAEEWSAEYRKNDTLKWQAEYSRKLATEAWSKYYDSLDRPNI
jgi:hypothetical protein